MSKTKILSIDVGIKNLAFCLFNKNLDTNFYEIEKWEIININEKTDKNYCKEKDKKNTLCNKEAKYQKNGCYYCKKHAKNTDFLFPCDDLKKSNINKLKINELKEIALKYNIIDESNKKFNKNTLLQIIHTFIDDKVFDNTHNGNTNNTYDIIYIAKNIKKHFDNFFNPVINDINHVCIENQMTSKMRIISYMIVEYFIMKKDDINITMVSPCYKLKGFENDENTIDKDDKSTYNERKKKSIKFCLHMLKESQYNDWDIYFNKHKKKDDLSDCFLQGVWYIDNKVT